MGEFWKSIEPTVVTALVALIPVLGFAVKSWIQTRQRQWEAAQGARQQAVALGESVPGDVPEHILEQWAMSYLQKSNPKITDTKARALVQRAAAADPTPAPVPLDRDRITLPSPDARPPGSDPPRSG